MKNDNRRSFLRNSALFGTTLFASSSFANIGLGNKESAAAKKINSKTIKHRKLGTGEHSLDVSALGLGCMGMSYHRSFIPEKKYMIQLIRNAVEMGVNLFDTAEVYGPFRNEELVGEALAPIRKNIILCSKFGFNIQNGQWLD